MDRVMIADHLSAKLGLSTPPICLAFVSSALPEIDHFAGQVPSACAFWREAESRVFYAPAESHFNCPVGAMTMGFDLPAPVQQELGGLVETMCACGYLNAEEPGKIPSVGRGSRGIVYGPLHAFPLDPDVILMWLTPRQAMLCGEAAGSCRWTEDVPTAVFGRPACAVLPVALANSRPASSFGCMGMRTFTEIGDDRMLMALPAAAAEEFVRALDATFAVNEQMRVFYAERKARLSA